VVLHPWYRERQSALLSNSNDFFSADFDFNMIAPVLYNNSRGITVPGSMTCPFTSR